jgi:hypothetical protein
MERALGPPAIPNDHANHHGRLARGYAAEVIARVRAAYTLPPLVVLATVPVITYGVLALLITWTIAYRSAMRQKNAADRARALSP